MQKNKNDFFLEVSCVKITIFSQPREKALQVVRKGTFLHNLFFSEYGFWSQVGASGVVYSSFLGIYG